MIIFEKNIVAHHRYLKKPTYVRHRTCRYGSIMQDLFVASAPAECIPRRIWRAGLTVAHHPDDEKGQVLPRGACPCWGRGQVGPLHCQSLPFCTPCLAVHIRSRACASQRAKGSPTTTTMTTIACKCSIHIGTHIHRKGLLAREQASARVAGFEGCG